MPTANQDGSTTGANPVEQVRSAIDGRAPVLGAKVALLAQRGRVASATFLAQDKKLPARAAELAAERGEKLSAWLNGIDSTKLIAQADALRVRLLKVAKPSRP